MNDRDAILELIQRYADEISSPDENSFLESILRGDADTRELFRVYMELDAALVDLGDAATLCAASTSSSVGSLLSLRESNSRESGSGESGSCESSSGESGSRVVRVSLAVVAAVACLFLAIVGLWPVKENQAYWATIDEAGPGVNIVRHGQSRPAHAEDQLLADELIVVPKEGAAQVVVAGLGIVALGPEARLGYGGEPRLVELETGFAEIAAVKQIDGQPWRIRTPQVEAAVLGTDFNIASAKGRTALRVSEGVVLLTSLHGGQSKRIRGGSRAIVVEGAALDVATSRPGSVLLLTSREPLTSHWDRFNQLLIDKLLSVRMWRLGFRVEVRHYEEVQAIDLTERSLVIVSLFDYDVAEPAIERIGLAHAKVPVICMEPAAYPVLGMTVETEGVGFGFRTGSTPVKFLDATHPLSGGLAGSQENIIRGVIGWGRPENEAELIAHLPGQADQSVVFCYDVNRQMANFPAPARRVGLFLDPTGIREQATEAWTVFEAAVDWCVATGVSL